MTRLFQEMSYFPGLLSFLRPDYLFAVESQDEGSLMSDSETGSPPAMVDDVCLLAQ